MKGGKLVIPESQVQYLPFEKQVKVEGPEDHLPKRLKEAEKLAHSSDSEELEVVEEIEGDSYGTQFVKERKRKASGHGRQFEGEKSSFGCKIDKLLSGESQLHKYPKTKVTSQRVTCVTEQEEATGGVTKVDVTHTEVMRVKGRYKL